MLQGLEEGAAKPAKLWMLQSTICHPLRLFEKVIRGTLMAGSEGRNMSKHLRVEATTGIRICFHCMGRMRGLGWSTPQPAPSSKPVSTPPGLQKLNAGISMQEYPTISRSYHAERVGISCKHLGPTLSFVGPHFVPLTAPQMVKGGPGTQQSQTASHLRRCFPRMMKAEQGRWECQKVDCEQQALTVQKHLQKLPLDIHGCALRRHNHDQKTMRS